MGPTCSRVLFRLEVQNVVTRWLDERWVLLVEINTHSVVQRGQSTQQDTHDSPPSHRQPPTPRYDTQNCAQAGHRDRFVGVEEQ